MPDISITVTDKRPVCTAGTTVVCDNSDYIVHWDLDEEWSAYDTKTMRVIYMDSTYADTVFTGDSVALPPVPVPGVVQIGLYAGDIHTSRMALLRALSSVRSASGAPANPTPDVYDQLMELIKGLGGVDPDDIAKAVADYLAAHPIEETDPTVPEWAKAKTKPTYSAAEVGAISQSDLQAATDTALAQAKASGEFDGPRGPAGAPGKDGAGMDITGATVGQITKITAVDASGKPTAWSPVDMPSGGGGGETWTLLGTLDASTADVLQLDFAQPIKKLNFNTQLTDSAGGQYTPSTTTYRTVSLKVEDTWENLNALNLGGCSNARGYKYSLWLNCDTSLPKPKGEIFGTIIGGQATPSALMFVGSSKTYKSGLITGIKFSLVKPDGTENTASGTIEVWGVKA